MIFSHITQVSGEIASMTLPVAYPNDVLSRYQQLSANSAYSMLLESAEIDSKNSVKSIMLLDAALRIECNGMQVTISAVSANGQSLLPYLADKLQSQAEVSLRPEILHLTFSQPDPLLEENLRLLQPNPFSALRVIQQQLRCHSDEPFAVFLGGAISYDMVATVEQLPDVAIAENQCPDYVFYLAETLLVLDHKTEQSRLIGNVFCGEQAPANCFVIGNRLEQLKQLLAEPIPVQTSIAADRSASENTIDSTVSVDISDDDFKAQVEQLKHRIVAGDIFQVVPSRCFTLACPNPFAAYAKLKQQNPSPYMFYLQDAAFTLFGASPESALKFAANNRQVEIYPIAGTRRRGFAADGSIDNDLDSRIELELRQDEKEKAEHLMLVDLARNDVARISVPGSRYVKELLKVDRYSYVMHLVSRVIGTLKPELDALHAYQACMNMGTLVGAPKVKAAELIRGVEGKRRGSYGGAVGYLAGNGDFDSCIVIRSAYVANNTAYIQAGAGVVFDSVAQDEANETRSKAQAVISAILSANASAQNRTNQATVEE
ncbi:anthranilate synthase component 1 [Rheinheimera salexigens]|uniref:Anthranilate synthase component 1 n=1 Tax=Rheinheimera salexigens TaxID=1628148 RepID=A0A1E7Q8A7_9GAMM|nr:anthranilate synthase component 1 [Rheinheimera salexigens]OEY70409.1 anthranilate synthase component I [Rheinheimera salexigens]